MRDPQSPQNPMSFLGPLPGGPWSILIFNTPVVSFLSQVAWWKNSKRKEHSFLLKIFSEDLKRVQRLRHLPYTRLTLIQSLVLHMVPKHHLSTGPAVSPEHCLVKLPRPRLSQRLERQLKGLQPHTPACVGSLDLIPSITWPSNTSRSNPGAPSSQILKPPKTQKKSFQIPNPLVRNEAHGQTIAKKDQSFLPPCILSVIGSAEAGTLKQRRTKEQEVRG